ncbi:head completion/stabilization protein [Sphingomonas sp. CBMAI 2297]|uniref:head completion/stabilization protein n=1 Tax=Sphingomonas sp. CBMAI 2297 TaxID=2991720 RepID=UPI0024563F9C|nr:head completion/stabilization protein [Sphingomonas sp. CBMAI 2297]MDH4743163.1 head completion/stabilization protein [Sphingomonas sp. CBMAI 2297]
MSGFACAPSIVPPPDPPSGAAIVNDGWFPDIHPEDLRKAVRIRDAVTGDQLTDAIVRAMLWANPQLEPLRLRNLGAASLAAVSSPQINGESRLVVLYRIAISAWVKASLVERQRDVDLTGAGQRKADDNDPVIPDLRRDALHAIRDMLGVGRTAVELI